MPGYPHEFIAVIASALAFTLVDIHSQVKSIRALVRTTPFYFFCLIFSLLNLTAYAGLKTLAGDQIAKWAGGNQNFAFLITVIFSTFGCVAILQSFSLKAGGKKIMDIAGFVDQYRSNVVAQAKSKRAEIQRAIADNLADRLVNMYQGDHVDLRTDYFQVMDWSGQDQQSIEDALDSVRSLATRLDLDLIRVLTVRMAATDPAAVRAILKRKRT